MKVKVIDYVGNPGGGLRFTGQLLKAMQDGGLVDEITFVSHGAALSRYRQALAAVGVRARFQDVPPARRARERGFTGHYVQSQVVSGCDIAWLPWIHFHRVEPSAAERVFGSFHDGLLFTEPTLCVPHSAIGEQEKETVRRWLASSATLVCSSHFWKDRLSEIFESPRDRMHVVPLSGDHARAEPKASFDRWPWLSAPYVMCAANITPHKNHEILFEGFAKAKLAWPLVLTGSGSSLKEYIPAWKRVRRSIGVILGLRRGHAGRASILRSRAEALGFVLGGSLLALGHLEDDDYDAVLDHAACLVMPTLGEGGGSFPVEEAVMRGIPVICSDIPVIREQMERIDAEIMWFDPKSPHELATRLRELALDYPRIKAAAVAQMSRIKRRTWSEVAKGYYGVFSLRDGYAPAAKPSAAMRERSVFT
jgi:glycosyltransferase involved in cell wall biosynthesis